MEKAFTFIPCNSKPTFFFRAIVFLSLSLLGVAFLLGQQPYVKGSFPRDGSDGLIRNMYVSVKFVLPDERSRLDINSLRDTVVFMYPNRNPTDTVPAFLLLNDDLGNITLEPKGILEPNTDYTFEITEYLRDEDGNSFVPFKINFRTSEKALTKQISMNPHKKLPNRKRPIRMEDRREQQDTFLAQVDPEPPKRKEKKYKGTQAMVAKAPLDLLPQDGPETFNEEAEWVYTEAIADVPLAPFGQDNVPAEAETPMIALAKGVSGVSFPKKDINRNGKLPIQFSFSEKSEVRMIIKSTSGEIVKRESGVIQAGRVMRSISLKNIPPGSYMAMIKVGEEVVRNKILVRE